MPEGTPLIFSCSHGGPNFCDLLIEELQKGVVPILVEPVEVPGLSLWWPLLLQSMGSKALRIQELQFLGSRAQAQ